MLSTKEQRFLEQSDVFIRVVLSELGLVSLEEVPVITERLPFAAPPVIVEDFRRLTNWEIEQLAQSYFSEYGVAYFIVLNPDAPLENKHPIFHITEQLRTQLNLQFPLEHPLEKHPEALKRFGSPDGTLKVYNLETRDAAKGYREQGETSEKFDMHNDGLGSGGSVQTAVLYTEGQPLFGGYTYFSAIPVLALHLAKTDIDAYRALFLPNAITMTRPRGKGALRVTSPILYLGEDGGPKVMFRLPSGEYQIALREDYAPLKRAWDYLVYYSRPFAPGTFFVHFTEKGHGCLIRNHWVAHGRTEFLESNKPHFKRVLARKWFMDSERDREYKHVPGIFLQNEYASLFPEYFAQELLIGEWLYDAIQQVNVRVR